MGTSTDQESPADAEVTPQLSGRGVVYLGSGLILVQLTFRAWAVFGAWFQFDDFAFMSRVMNSPLHEVLLRPYAGHVMPGGFLLTWVNHQLAPLSWALPASELLAMQAVASVGCLVLLVSAFGPRPGILPPLAVYLFSVISLPAFIWWAAGINQLPLQIAFFWGLLTHLAYLRTRRAQYAIYTLLVALLGLAFYEKTLLLFPLLAVVTIAYFARGDVVERLRMVWDRYRPAVLLYGLAAGGYIVLYALRGLNFSPGEANQKPLGPAFVDMVGRGFTTGVVGGPLRWERGVPPFATAAPTSLTVVVACVALGLLGWEANRARVRSKRAWLVPALLLGFDVVLVVAGRSSVHNLTLDYRYQTELAAAAALALGLSLMPLLGAVESAETRRPSAFFDRPRTVTAVTVVVSVLALVSSVQYAGYWQSAHRSRQYFDNVEKGLTSTTGRLPMVDEGVPTYLMWAFGYPENATSHVLRMYSKHTRFTSISTDRLFMVDGSGRVEPVVVPPVRQERKGPEKCGWLVGDSSVRIPLNGPVIGGGWWVRIGYAATGDSPVTVTAGDRRYDTWVFKGFHSLYFEAAGRFSAIRVSGLKDGVRLCTNDVTLGLPEPLRSRRER